MVPDGAQAGRGGDTHASGLLTDAFAPGTNRHRSRPKSGVGRKPVVPAGMVGSSVHRAVNPLHRRGGTPSLQPLVDGLYRAGLVRPATNARSLLFPGRIPLALALARWVGMTDIAKLREGRSHQKQRTRSLLLAAALELAKAGTTPTVANVAKRANVSRANAYRYFPTAELLMTEAALTAGSPMSVGDVFLPDTVASPLSTERADLMVQAIHSAVCRDITKVRLFMRATLDHSGSHGGAGRDHALRMQLIDFALAPLTSQITPARLSTLRSAIAVIVGLETMLTFANVLHVDVDEALRVKRWAVKGLIEAALAERQADPS